MGRWIQLIIFSCLLVGCELFWVPRSSEIYRVSISRTFDKIVLNDHINLMLVQDTTNFAVIETLEGRSESVLFDYSGTTLNIETSTLDRAFNGYKDVLNVELHFVNFQELFLKGGGKVSGDTIRQDQFILSANQSGGEVSLILDVNTFKLQNATGTTYYDLKGKVDHFNLFSDAAYGPVDASTLVSNNVFLQSNGSNNIKIQALNNLTIQATHQAKIEYWGSPEINIKEKAKGVSLQAK